MKKTVWILLIILFLTGCSRNDADTVNQVNDNLNNSYEKLKYDYKSILDKSAKQDNDIEQHKREITELEAKISILTNENEELNKKNSELSKKIQFINNSENVISNSFKNGCFFMDDIEKIMKLNETEITKFFGLEYTINYLRDGYEECYFYHGCVFAFGLYNNIGKIDFISCDSIFFKGSQITTDMNFKQIQDILGNSKINEIPKVEPYDPVFSLTYIFDDYILWFGATHKDKAIQEIQVRRR